MSDETNFLQKFVEYIPGMLRDNWGWMAGLGAVAVVTVRKIHRHFTAINRLADKQEEMAAEIKQIKEKQERLVDSDGVDLRVKPVIESVMDIKSQVSDIHNYFMNREPNERSGDRK